MRRQVLISVVLIISMLTLSACGDNASTNVEEVSLDSATAEAVVDTAKDVTEKTEEEVKGTVTSETSTVVDSNGASATTAVLVDDTDEEVILTASDTVKVTDGNNIPTLSGKYVGDGNGPGAYWRSDFDYTMYIEDYGHLDDVVIKTAPNGVKVKAVPFLGEGKEAYTVIVDGQGKDLEPGSPYMEAVNYFFYNADNAYYWATDFSAIDATLPTT